MLTLYSMAKGGDTEQSAVEEETKTQNNEVLKGDDEDFSPPIRRGPEDFSDKFGLAFKKKLNKDYKFEPELILKSVFHTPEKEKKQNKTGETGLFGSLEKIKIENAP